MCYPLAIMAAATALSAYGAYQQGQTTQKIAHNNQILGNYAADNSEKQGEEAAMRVRQQGDQMLGAQRARMAASGLDLTSGTPADLQDQTSFFSQSDQNMARNNARRQAWAYRQQGINAAAQGDAAAQQGNLQAFSTVLGAAGQVSGKWYTPSSTGVSTISGGNGLSSRGYLIGGN